MPDLEVLVAYSAAVAVLTLTPGPDMALYLGKTIGGGRAAGVASFLGTAAGLVVHAGLAAVGVAAVLAASATAFLWLKVAGCLYLLYLAQDAVRNGAAFAIAEGGSRREPLGRLFAKGFAVNILNPKIVVFFVTFLPQFVAAGDPDAHAKLLFLGLWYVAVTAPITAVLILAASRIAGSLRRRPGVVRLLDWIFAGLMAAFAVRLARSLP